MRFSSYVRKIHLTADSVIFYKFLLFFIIAVSVPAIGIGVLSIKHSSENIIKQAAKTNTSILVEKKETINRKVNEAENVIYQLMSNQKVLNLTSMKSIQLNGSDKIDMLEILKLIKGNISYNNRIESIYIFDINHDFVLADTKYTKADFYDQQILNLKFDGNLAVDIHRVMLPGRGVSTKVISYIKRFEDFSSGNRTFISVNFVYDSFFNDLKIANGIFPMSILVFDGNNEVVHFNGELPKPLDKANVGDIASSEESFVKKIDKKDYFICKTDLEVFDWTIAYIQPYENLVQTTFLLRNLIVYSLLVIIILSIIMAYLFSVYLYRPLAKLASAAVSCYDSVSHDGRGNKRINEYNIIDKAIKTLFNQNNELNSKYEMTFPYLRHHFVNDLFSDNSFDSDKFKKILDLLGICFTYSSFAAIIIDFENRPFTKETGNFLDSRLMDYKEGLNYILSTISSSRILILINTEYDKNLVFAMLSKIKEDFNLDNIQITMSIGNLYEGIGKLYMSYTEALKQINSKFFSGKNEIINFTGPVSPVRKFFYDTRIEEEMISHIKSQEIQKAISSMEKLTAELLDNSNSMEYIKYVYFQVVNNIIGGLEDVGIEPSQTDMSNTFIFENINRAGTIQDLRLFVNSFIEKSISLLKTVKEKRHADLVKKTIAFIESNYQNDLSLDDIAQKIFLSPRYINSIFKAETGKTIFDYITGLRMEKAKSLLVNENIKIQDIARDVGYNSIQSFNRLFKLYNKLAPLEYRRRFNKIE